MSEPAFQVSIFKVIIFIRIYVVRFAFVAVTVGGMGSWAIVF